MRDSVARTPFPRNGKKEPSTRRTGKEEPSQVDSGEGAYDPPRPPEDRTQRFITCALLEWNPTLRGRGRPSPENPERKEEGYFKLLSGVRPRRPAIRKSLPVVPTGTVLAPRSTFHLKEGSPSPLLNRTFLSLKLFRIRSFFTGFT
ncbi:hypothetical protein AXX17_ATUG04030 (mitochondrion) [Arabidopsis thaliana]|uniref:Uncharacterized protein n=1 Tax=Arabidopsis thaliana TaxID=3702 RepID=A0A178U7C7_ARATH|nr:hypothetical protein AXX17_ATUG04030 [Arabidopsis thaliana]